ADAGGSRGRAGQEDIRPAAIRRYEAKTLARVEELDRACAHTGSISGMVPAAKRDHAAGGDSGSSAPRAGRQGLIASLNPQPRGCNCSAPIRDAISNDN